MRYQISKSEHAFDFKQRTNSKSKSLDDLRAQECLQETLHGRASLLRYRFSVGVVAGYEAFRDRVCTRAIPPDNLEALFIKEYFGFYSFT